MKLWKAPEYLVVTHCLNNNTPYVLLWSTLCYSEHKQLLCTFIQKSYLRKVDCEQLDGNVSASVPVVRFDISCAEPLRLIATTLSRVTEQD